METFKSKKTLKNLSLLTSLRTTQTSYLQKNNNNIKNIEEEKKLIFSMSRYDVANLKIRLGEHKIKSEGDTIFESKVSRVVRHKEFSQQTLVRILIKGNVDDFYTAACSIPKGTF